MLDRVEEWPTVEISGWSDAKSLSTNIVTLKGPTLRWTSIGPDRPPLKPKLSFEVKD